MKSVKYFIRKDMTSIIHKIVLVLLVFAFVPDSVIMLVPHMNAWEKWNKERTQRLDFINERLRKEHHAVQTFDDVDRAMKLYYYVTHKNLRSPLKPKLGYP